MLPYRARRQLPLSQQRCLVLADMFKAQLIRWPMEVRGELLNHVNVTANRPRRVITASFKEVLRPRGWLRIARDPGTTVSGKRATSTVRQLPINVVYYYCEVSGAS